MVAKLRPKRKRIIFRMLVERDQILNHDELGFELRCYICKKSMSKKRATIDHVIARSKGGNHDLKNLKLACFKCNQQKGNC